MGGWCLFCSNSLLGWPWCLCLEVPCKYKYVVGVFILDGLHGFVNCLGDALLDIVLYIVDVGNGDMFIFMFHCDHVASSVCRLRCVYNGGGECVCDDCCTVFAVDDGGFLVKEFVMYCRAGVVRGVLGRFLDG